MGFQSDKWQDAEPEQGQAYDQQVLAYFTIFVIVSSMVYFMVVLSSEIAIGLGFGDVLMRYKCTQWCLSKLSRDGAAALKVQQDRKNGRASAVKRGSYSNTSGMSAADQILLTMQRKHDSQPPGAGGTPKMHRNDSSDVLTMQPQMNPMMEKTSDEEKNAQSEKEKKEMQDAMEGMQEELRKAKKAAAVQRQQAQQGQLGHYNSSARMKKSGAGKKKKKLFDGGSDSGGDFKKHSTGMGKQELDVDDGGVLKDQL